MNVNKQIQRNCTICATKYLAGSNSIYCPDCAYDKQKEREKEYAKERYQRRKAQSI